MSASKSDVVRNVNATRTTCMNIKIIAQTLAHFFVIKVKISNKAVDRKPGQSSNQVATFSPGERYPLNNKLNINYSN